MAKLYPLLMGGGWACDEDYAEGIIYIEHPRTVRGSTCHTSIFMLLSSSDRDGGVSDGRGKVKGGEVPSH